MRSNNGNGNYGAMSGMGDYEIFGVKVPDAGELLQTAQNAIVGQAANAVVTSPTIKAAAATGAVSALSTKISEFILKNKTPLMYGGAAVAVLITAKMMIGKKSA